MADSASTSRSMQSSKAGCMMKGKRGNELLQPQRGGRDGTGACTTGEEPNELRRALECRLAI